MSRHDGPSADDIERMLVDRIEDVVSELYPGSKIVGPVAYCSWKSAKDLGSFQVHIRTHGKFQKGSWNRWSAGVGGGVLNLAAYALTGSHKGKEEYCRAIEWAKGYLGITSYQESEADKQAREERRIKAEAERAADQKAADEHKAKRRKTASGQWEDGVSIIGTPAEAYLVGVRGLPRELVMSAGKDVLRFNPSVHYDKPPFTDHPCLLGRVQGFDGKGKALGRVFLTQDGRKAILDDPKLTIGAMDGGAVRLGGIAKRIGIAEGMETALGAMALYGGSLPVWATLGTSGMAAFECPMGIYEVIIFADGDMPRIRNERVIQPGLDAARRLEARLQEAGIKVSILSPPYGKDWLDVWVKSKEYREEIEHA